VNYVRNEVFWVVFGVLFLVFGIMANVTALGLFGRKRWGRVMAFVCAVLAILIVLIPKTLLSPIQITASFRLQVAQVLYGILAFAVLSGNPDERKGIYTVRLVNFSAGLPLMIVFGMYSLNAAMLLLHSWPVSNTDSRFAMLIAPSGFITGFMLFASSLCLLMPRWKRPTIVFAFLIAAISAEVALAASTLSNGLLGHTRAGMREFYILFLLFPACLVLLILTASGLWYLTRSHIRHALRDDREQPPVARLS
jgi:hypothetical protein